MFPAQLENVSVFCITRDFTVFLHQEIEIFENNIVYLIDSQVYGDNILQL